MRKIDGVGRVRVGVAFCLLVIGAVAAQGQTGDRVEGLLQRLADAAGPPGAEEPVRGDYGG